MELGTEFGPAIIGFRIAAKIVVVALLLVQLIGMMIAARGVAVFSTELLMDVVKAYPMRRLPWDLHVTSTITATMVPSKMIFGIHTGTAATCFIMRSSQETGALLTGCVSLVRLGKIP
jgi:hypothetical protein